jgi:hypothetical protein
MSDLSSVVHSIAVQDVADDLEKLIVLARPASVRRELVEKVKRLRDIAEEIITND